jgi:hypothetical protein
LSVEWAGIAARSIIVVVKRHTAAAGSSAQSARAWTASIETPFGDWRRVVRQWRPTSRMPRRKEDQGAAVEKMDASHKDIGAPTATWIAPPKTFASTSKKDDASA